MIELTCILCPKGCRLRVDDKNGYRVTGNTCPRGAAYGREEALHPTRTVTSTVRIFFEKNSEPATAKTCASDGSRHDLLAPPMPLVSYFYPNRPKIEARLPVKTSAPIAKDKIFEVMEAINRITVRGPVQLGDIILSGVAGTDVDILATRTMNAPDHSAQTTSLK